MPDYPTAWCPPIPRAGPGPTSCPPPVHDARARTCSHAQSTPGPAATGAPTGSPQRDTAVRAQNKSLAPPAGMRLEGATGTNGVAANPQHPPPPPPPGIRSGGGCRHPGVTGGDTAAALRQTHGWATCRAPTCRADGTGGLPPPLPPPFPARGALLGQVGLEHSRASAWAPRHSAQPWAETLHLRVRCCVPLAQVTEQRLQAPHSSHCPSTAGTSESGVRSHRPAAPRPHGPQLPATHAGLSVQRVQPTDVPVPLVPTSTAGTKSCPGRGGPSPGLVPTRRAAAPAALLRRNAQPCRTAALAGPRHHSPPKPAALGVAPRQSHEPQRC